MLEKFVKTLSEIDNEEHKQQLMIESIINDEEIDPTNSIELNLFDKEPDKPILDPEFEKVLVSMDIPNDVPETQRHDYITDTIDHAMGIKKEEPVIGPAPVYEDAGDIDISPKKVITMKPADHKALVAIVAKYNEDTQNKSKNRTTLKKFIAGVLRGLSTTTEMSSSVKNIIEIMFEKFCANAKLPDTEDVKAQLVAKLQAINKSI